MPLTLNQFLFLVLAFAAVVAATFLVIYLIQLRRTAAEGQRTLSEIRKLAENLNELSGVVKDKIEDLGQIMEASKRTVSHLSEASFILTARLLKPASRYWPFIYPLVRLLWKQRQKRKEKKNGK
jgi:ABC-type transporter Mla subunit MlaD